MLHIATYFPQQVLTNEQLAQINPAYNFDRLAQKIGINARHVASETETVLDLAYQACKKLFTTVDANTVDYILLCTQSPNYFFPTTACLLQDKLGLRTDIGALDFNLGCSGYVYGLSMAKSLIKGGMAKNVLLVTAETYTKHIHPSDMVNRAIFGDAATATLVNEAVAAALMNFDFGTDGAGGEHLNVKGGAGAQNFNHKHSLEESFYMNGSKVFEFTLSRIPQSIQQCLLKNHLDISDINYTILHQANQYMIKQLQKKCALPPTKVHNNVLTTGNTVSNSIPIALKQSLDNTLINKGDYVLLCGFGVGLSWATTIIKF